jgi:hypothetical protein
MDCRHWLERVAEELAGQGLPARVRVRLMDELRDHVDDLTERGTDMATDTQIELWMGSPEELAAGAVADYRRTAWVRRHPFLVFGIAPIPLAFLGVVLYLLAFAAIGYAVEVATQSKGGLEALPRNIILPVATGFTYSIRFVPFLFLAIAFSMLAIRNRMSWWWLASSVLQVAILGGAATSQMHQSDVPGKSTLMVGIGVPFADWLQAIQVLVPLAIGGAFLLIASRGMRSVQRVEQPI